jgi:hypothetical protein
VSLLEGDGQMDSRANSIEAIRTLLSQLTQESRDHALHIGWKKHLNSSLPELDTTAGC